jgi:hypothetical protein
MTDCSWVNANADLPTVGRRPARTLRPSHRRLEISVEKPRFAGNCHKADNGHTQGRGILDTRHLNSQPIKSIWIHRLERIFASVYAIK